MVDNANQRESSNTAAPLTDSAWFWAALFATAALAALFVISGKYGKRQANIEQKYQARERVNWEEEDRRQKAEGSEEYSRPGETVISLWPLAVPLGGVIVVSVVMLVRRRKYNSRNAVE